MQQCVPNAVHILQVHVHVVAAVERPRADVADENAGHGGVHGATVARQVGVFRELGRALATLVEALLHATHPPGAERPCRPCETNVCPYNQILPSFSQGPLVSKHATTFATLPTRNEQASTGLGSHRMLPAAASFSRVVDACLLQSQIKDGDCGTSSRTARIQCT